MASTKKLLVAFDPSRPQAFSNDFLIPWEQGGERALLGLSSAKHHVLGLMVFLGRPVTENDLFAKLVDSGASVPDVHAMMSLLQAYIGQVRGMKIGNVVRLASPDGDNRSDLVLELVAKTPSAAHKE